MRGRFLLGFSNANSKAAGVVTGDQVEVEVELDAEPRLVVEPADFARALDADPVARAAYERMSYSNKRSICTLSRAQRSPRRAYGGSKRRWQRCMRTGQLPAPRPSQRGRLGPKRSAVRCLSRHAPRWDRTRRCDRRGPSPPAPALAPPEPGGVRCAGTLTGGSIVSRGERRSSQAGDVAAPAVRTHMPPGRGRGGQLTPRSESPPPGNSELTRPLLMCDVRDASGGTARGDHGRPLSWSATSRNVVTQVVLPTPQSRPKRTMTVSASGAT
jgi:hypothetical protein